MTVAVVEPAADVQPLLSVIVTKYVPLAAVVALAIDGACCDEAKLFGPVQLYVAPATVGVLRVSVPPAQIGPSLLAVGVDGSGLTVTVPEPLLAQPVEPSVTVTV